MNTENFISGTESGSFITAEFVKGGGIGICVADALGGPATSIILTPAGCDRLVAQIKQIYDDHGLARC